MKYVKQGFGGTSIHLNHGIWDIRVRRAEISYAWSMQRMQMNPAFN